MHPTSQWLGSSASVPSTGYFAGKGSTPMFHQLSSTTSPTTSPPTTSMTPTSMPHDFGMVPPTWSTPPLSAGHLFVPDHQPSSAATLPLQSPPPPTLRPVLVPREPQPLAPQPLPPPPVPHHQQTMILHPQVLTPTTSALPSSHLPPQPPPTSNPPPTSHTVHSGHPTAAPHRPRQLSITAELRRMIESTVDSKIRTASKQFQPKPAPLPPPAEAPPPPAEAPPPPPPPPSLPEPLPSRPHDDHPERTHRSRTRSRKSSPNTRQRTSHHTSKSNRPHRSKEAHRTSTTSHKPSRSSRTHTRDLEHHREPRRHPDTRNPGSHHTQRGRSPVRDRVLHSKSAPQVRPSTTSTPRTPSRRRSASHKDKSRRTPPRYRHHDMPRRSRRRSSHREDTSRRDDTSRRTSLGDRRSHREFTQERRRESSVHGSSTHLPRSPRHSSSTFRLRSRTRSHPHRSTARPNLVLTPNQHSSPHLPPLPPPTGTPPLPSTPPPPPPRPDWEATTTRVPEGDTDDSDAPRDATAPIPAFSQSVGWVKEYQEAAADPHRPKLPSELVGPKPPLTDEFTATTKRLHKEFIDMMYQCLAEPYTTRNGSQLHIKVDRSAVDNLALCFAKSNMLDVNLAKGTKGWFIENNRLLTVTIPTGFDLRPPFHQDESAWYLCYHKTDWINIPKILLDKMVRPAAWSRDEHGQPSQYPSYGFFGYASQVGSRDLTHYAVDVCTRNLNKIGKSQYPAGVLTITRCPVWERTNAGGNDQLQRQCRYSGAARGKEGYAAMHSAFASVQWVTVTFNLNPSDLSWISVTELDNDLARGPPQAPAT